MAGYPQPQPRARLARNASRLLAAQARETDFVIGPAAYFGQLHELLCHCQVTTLNQHLVSLETGLAQVTDIILEGRGVSCGRESRKVLLVGNGGSAGIASHVHNDLTKAVGARALVFNEAALLTALSNDAGYESAFETLTRLWASPGDLMIAISSSGRSANILRAVAAARGRGCAVVTLSGFASDNVLRRQGDLNFYIASCNYGLVELAHSVILHFITDRASVSPGQAVGQEE
jgi:phosphoheptose isomerase